MDLQGHEKVMVGSVDLSVKKALVSNKLDFGSLSVYDYLLKRFEYIRRRYIISKQEKDNERLGILSAMMDRVENLNSSTCNYNL